MRLLCWVIMWCHFSPATHSMALCFEQCSILGVASFPLRGLEFCRSCLLVSSFCFNMMLPPANFCRHYGFISYCVQCGNSQSISWDKLGQMRCPCNDVCSYSLPLIWSFSIFVASLLLRSVQTLNFSIY